MADERESHPPDKPADCTCPYAWRKDIGRLYGISMGSGWVRLSDADDCPEHARGRSHGGYEASPQSEQESI